MKLLNEIIKHDNAIHASIHKKDKKIKEDYSPSDETINSHLDKIKKDNEGTQAEHESLSKHYTLEGHQNSHHLRNYTDGSYSINSHLWKQHKGKPSTKTELHDAESVPHIDKILDSYKTPNKMKVYSGTIHDPQKAKDENNIVHHPAYLSTSIKRTTAEGFADIQKGQKKHVLSISVPKGSKGMYIGDHSFNKDEREFLLPRNSKLKHIKTDVHEEEHPIYGKINMHVHHMELLKS